MLSFMLQYFCLLYTNKQYENTSTPNTKGESRYQFHSLPNHKCNGTETKAQASRCIFFTVQKLKIQSASLFHCLRELLTQSLREIIWNGKSPEELLCSYFMAQPKLNKTATKLFLQNWTRWQPISDKYEKTAAMLESKYVTQLSSPLGKLKLRKHS